MRVVFLPHFVVSQFFSAARHARFPKLGSKPGWLKRQSKILPLSHEETSANKENLNAYVSHVLFTYICLTATESSIYIYIYIYIYTHKAVLKILYDGITWRCQWCNGYRRRKWTRRHEFKSSTRLIAFHIALIPLGKVWIQLFSLHLWGNSRTD